MNIRRYPSKIGLSVVLVPLVVILGSGTLMVIQEIRMGLIPLLLVSAYIVHLFLNTYYVIDGRQLRIRCGLFFNQTIEISNIKKVTRRV